MENLFTKTIIAYVSQFMTLKTGDYIFTGTPAGVGPVAIGDKLEAFIEALCNTQILEVVRTGVSGISRGERSLAL